MNIKILCCYYKDNDFIPSSDIYLPIQCGKSVTNIEWANIPPDNTGDNISERNTYYSEITGLYWAWKNLKNIDIIGVCSYRRFFNFNFKSHKVVKILPRKDYREVNNIVIPDIEKLMTDYGILLAKPYIYATSLATVWKRNYRSKDTVFLESTILKLSPEYFDAYMSSTKYSNRLSGHNMFIMSWEEFDKFCSWVFPILFELEKHIDPTNYSKQQIRVYGYIHELLLNVYAEKHKLKVKYSQLLWIRDGSKKFRFNNVLYKIAAKVLFFIKIDIKTNQIK